MIDFKVVLNTWGAYSHGQTDYGWMTIKEARKFIEDNPSRDGGEWYIVDPTFNDVLYDTGEQKTNYRLFNAGKDRCAEYYWPAEFEYNQIAETCKDQYFYNHRGTRFDSLKSISEHITANWLMGQTEFDVMLSGQVCSWGDLSDVLYDDLMLTNKQFNYHIWCYHTSKDTFFKVVFY